MLTLENESETRNLQGFVKKVSGEIGLGFAKSLYFSSGALSKNLKLEFDIFSSIMRQLLKLYSPVSYCRRGSHRKNLSKSFKGVGRF